MVEAVTARWHGDNYQARVFWDNALNLLVSEECVAEVTFEANGPKSFDDVIVKYDPPVVRSGLDAISVDYHQVKWHTETGGRFGYKDLTDPAFIGAQSVSLLQRLQEAKKTAPETAQFTFLTVYRIFDDDPLRLLIAGTDKSLLLHKLFDGTTDRSRMGQVRKCWREHLSLKDDEQLRVVLKGLRIFESHRTLEELRAQINFKAKAVGMLVCDASTSNFTYDELARKLKIRQLNSFTREQFLEMARAEGLLRPGDAPATSDFLPIAIKSFLGTAADGLGAKPENTLILVDSFNERYICDDQDWQNDIAPRVRQFLKDCAAKSPKLRLSCDAHASIAFLAGSILDFKSGTEVQLVQKGRVGNRIWTSDEGADGPSLVAASRSIGSGLEIAVAINATHSVEGQVQSYVSANLPGVGPLLTFTPGAGQSQQSIAGGRHAAKLAESIAQAIGEARGIDRETRVHIFAACPNSLLYFLGQHHRVVSPCLVYEFDFDRQGNKSYQPSFIMD